MRKILSLVSVSLLSGVLLLQGCAQPASSQVNLDQEFTLDYGGSTTISSENIDVKFVDVVSDSRCPKGATCVWAGEASVLIEVTQSPAAPAQLVLTSTGGAQQTSFQDYAGYRIAFSIEPYPVLGTTVSKNDYKLVMTVSKSTEPTTPATVISPAPIHDVTIATTLDTPPSVLADIQIGLKDSCTSFFNLSTERSGSTITITVNVQTQTGQICAEIYTFLDKTVDLGSDFVSGQAYTLKVNDQTKTFTMP